MRPAFVAIASSFFTIEGVSLKPTTWPAVSFFRMLSIVAEITAVVNNNLLCYDLKMKQTCIAMTIFATVLLAVPAHAETRPFDYRPVLVLVAGQTADLATTLRFLHTGRCVEGNALYGPQPSSSKLLVSSLALTGGIAAVSVFAVRSESHAVRAIGKALAYFGGGFGAATAVYNLRQCGV